MENFDLSAYQARTAWYQKARFGLFIHWGLYAIPARGEWLRSNERISKEDYQPYFHEFTAANFEPGLWAKKAKAAGFQYVVFTAKHHDGFCLFDSAYTDFKSTKTPFGRDAVAEVLEAFREVGIKVGLYYSIIDWHHDHYPHFGDRHHPMRDNLDFKDHQYDFDIYLDYMHKQVLELASNYGQLDILWFDFAYDDLNAQAFKGRELVEQVRQLQPQIIINNRLEASGEGFGSLIEAKPGLTSGDFVSPEQIIPPKGIFNIKGERVLWESCITLNDHWGYVSNDHNFKSSKLIVRKLVETVSKGGNPLVNVGPNALGEIPKESALILEEIAAWMNYNQESVIAAGPADLDKPEFGYITQNGKALYYHVFDEIIGYLPLSGLKPKQIEKVRLLVDGSELLIEKNWITNNYPDLSFVSLGSKATLVDPVDTVVKVYTK